jgi:integrase
MRSSEICGLTASQVHLNIQHISGTVLDYIDLGVFDTKTGARRTVPVSELLKEVLQRRLEGLEPDDYVFSVNGRKTSKGNVAGYFKRACNSAGVIHGDKVRDQKGNRIGIVFHCLRHTRTTLWVKAGYSDEIVRRATGHRSLSAFQGYVKLDPFTIMRLVESKQDKIETKSLQSL